MPKAKREQPLIQSIITAVETMGIEAMPVVANIGQETGLGASLPEATPKKAKKPAARSRARVVRKIAKKTRR